METQSPQDSTRVRRRYDFAPPLDPAREDIRQPHSNSGIRGDQDPFSAFNTPCSIFDILDEFLQRISSTAGALA
jgi:hypothetical protein